MDNHPLANAEIRFYPLAGSDLPYSVGETDQEGNYTLKLAQSGTDGAVVAEHRVEISVWERNQEKPQRPEGPREMVPRKYNRNSILTAVVPPEGRKDANFDLKSR
jgi:hypothetical protein